jgi:hypothetical protein
MTTTKNRRSGLSQSVFQIGLSTLSLGLLCAFGVSVQQLPPQEAPTKTQPEPLIPPTVAPQPNAPTADHPTEDHRNDPLFLEIQRMVLAGSAPTAANVPSNTTTELISNSRWHAAESILAAARILEQDVAECIARSDIEGGARSQKAILALRLQAMQLLR